MISVKWDGKKEMYIIKEIGVDHNSWVPRLESGVKNWVPYVKGYKYVK